MQTIKLSYPHSLQTKTIPDTVAAIGFFDGIHKGHQKVIQTAVKEAKTKNMESAVITFYPHPSVVLRKDIDSVQYITPLREKERVLNDLGVDRLYIITFNKELSSLLPQQFIDHFIIGLHIKHLVAGFDYSFGFKGQGNMENIGGYTRDMLTYTTIDKVEMGDEKVSSTRIRQSLQEGDVQGVTQLLGRPLTITGKVIQGAKRGREIGYPTANIAISSEALLPKPGIYAVKVQHGQKTYIGMASLGTNPTFTEEEVLSLEVNILDYSGNLYGEELTLVWQSFIRDEIKFDDVSSLIRQIEADERMIRQFFS